VTAEAIARVVGDLKAKNVRPVRDADLKVLHMALGLALVSGPVVDATEIYRSLVARTDPVDLYGDHPCIAPPWRDASICYVNEHGNVIVMTLAVDDHLTLTGKVGVDKEPWEPAEHTDWERVRWTMYAFVWVGGRSQGSPSPTGGPAHLWKFAVYDDGTPADLHWVHLVPEYPMEHWDMAHLVLLGALNFCNCRNVELVEPKRPRAEARRVARTGVQVHTINVFPTGKSARQAKADGGMGTPLTSVRGHFACYGPDYGRGLLFGKYAGRFWIPQHARGDSAVGESQSDYVLRTEAS
jgi:hypothetical protein